MPLGSAVFPTDSAGHGASQCDLGFAHAGVSHFDAGDAHAVEPTRAAPMVVLWRNGYPVSHRLRGIDGIVRGNATDAPPPAIGAAASRTPVTVVICTRDRPEELRRCLGSLPHQSLTPAEIVVVDNASMGDATRKVAKAAGVTYVREERPGLDYARNTGARRAIGDIVAYTDDDVRLHPRWLERLAAAFDAPEVGAVTGLVLPAELATEAQLHFETFWSFGRGYDRKDYTSEAFRAGSGVFPAWEIGAGASMAFRREVFDRAGLFDERLDVGRAGCSGDSEFWYRLLSLGYTCRYEPMSVAFHYHRRTMDGLASQLFHYMRGHSAALLVQHERTGRKANLRRAALDIPAWYLRRAIRPTQPRDRFLKEEAAGFVAGIGFYLRAPAMSDPVTVSVVIPARNAAGTLGQTLQSLRAQDFADWEAVIVDDGSVDETGRIAREHMAGEPRFQVIECDGLGPAAARNRGLEIARGRWLHFLDADDWVDPTFMRRMVGALRGAGDAVAAQCAYRRVMPDGALAPARIRHDVSVDPFACFARTCAAAIHAVLVDRRVVVDLGGFDTGLRTCEDWDLWQRVARLGGRWVTVDMPLAFYRTGSGSLTRNAAQMMRDCEVVVDRAFACGAQTPGRAFDQPHADPAGGTAAEAKAYFALWNIASSIGAGEDGLSADDHLSELPHQPQHAHALSMTILDGLMVGACAPPERLAGLWSDYGGRLCALLERLGALWNDADAALATQLALEGALLDYSPLRTTQRLGRTLGAPVELSALDVPALGQAEVVCLNVFDRGANPDRVTLGVLGQPDRSTLARHLIRRLGVPRALRAQARTAAAVSIAARAAPALFRALVAQPGAAWDRAGFKAAVVKAVEPVLVARAGPPAQESHDGALQAVKAAAAREVAGLAVRPHREAHSGAPQEQVRDGPRQAFWDDYFEVEDPWNYGSAYEQEKYAWQLALLPERPVGKALELACAEGHFSDLLAPRVGALLAVDISAKAVTRARARCERHGNAAFSVLDLTRDPLPPGMDLITCSEVLYYLRDRDELRAVARRIAQSLSPGGCLVTAHAYVLRDDMTRTGFDWDNPFGAETIANLMAETAGLGLERSRRCDLYRIDRFRRLRDGEPAPAPQIETCVREAPLDPSVARQVVWNGAAVLRADVMRAERSHGAPVLMYHSIAPDGPAALARYRVSPAAFRGQLTWLRKQGYYSLAPEQLAWSLANRQPLPGRPVMITFDDGLLDFADAAWPLLQTHGFDADVFVVTDRLGGAAIWDCAIAEPARLMSEATIRALAAQGVRFGSHLATHRAINGLTTRDLAEELGRSSAKIGALTGQAPFALAAPFSIGDRRLAGLAADFGYGLAFAARSGCASLIDDPLDAPRIEVHGDWPIGQFVAQMEAVRG